MKGACLLVLLLTACIYIAIVEQPSEVSVGEQFTIRVVGMVDSSALLSAGWLGMMLPWGIEVDSGLFIDNTGDTFVVTRPDEELSAWLEARNPPDTLMFWLGYNAGSDTSVKSFEALVFARVTDSAVAGGYLLDYRVGYNGPVGDHYTTDSVLDQPMTVTGLAVGEQGKKPALGRGLVWPAVFRERLNIAVAGTEDVGIYDAGGRQVRMLRVEGSGCWDGTDESGRRVPAGSYMVRGELVHGRVTLLD